MKVEIRQHRTMDYSDAARMAAAWIEGIADRRGLRSRPGCEIRYDQTGNDGTTITLWARHLPIAVATLLRDDMNYTVATFAEMGADAPSTTASIVLEAIVGYDCRVIETARARAEIAAALLDRPADAVVLRWKEGDAAAIADAANHMTSRHDASPCFEPVDKNC